jgi:hypothetical protein
MAQNFTEEMETALAAEILTLFERAKLTGAQAISLLDKVRTLVDAGEMGFFNRNH